VEDIVNHNCVGICSQQFCGNKETKFETFSIYGMEIVVGFCDECAEKLDNKIFYRGKEDAS
jgi:hypothetical protein